MYSILLKIISTHYDPLLALAVGGGGDQFYCVSQTMCSSGSFWPHSSKLPLPHEALLVLQDASQPGVKSQQEH